MLISNLIKIVSLAGVLFVFNFLWPLEDTKKHPDRSTAGSTAETLLEKPLAENYPETEIQIRARSACVFDALKNEFVFEKNADSQLPLASLTKLATAITAKENLLPGTLINISQEAISQDGDNGFREGELWSLEKILNAMLISSSNDAAFAVSETRSDFMELMNKTARKMGLKQTYFLNPTGLDISESLAGAYGSCRDMAKITRLILDEHREILEITAKETYKANGLTFKNTNKLLPKLPTLIGGKTGFDDLAGGNLMVAVDKGLHHPVIIVILGSTIEGRFEDVETLYNIFIK